MWQERRGAGEGGQGSAPQHLLLESGPAPPLCPGCRWRGPEPAAWGQRMWVQAGAHGHQEGVCWSLNTGSGRPRVSVALAGRGRGFRPLTGHHQLSPGCPVTSWEGKGSSLHVGVILSRLGDLCRVSSLGPAYRLRGLWRPVPGEAGVPGGPGEGQRGSWDVGARPLALKSSSWERPPPSSFLPSHLVSWPQAKLAGESCP